MYITEIDYTKCKDTAKVEQDILDWEMEAWIGFSKGKVTKNGNKLCTKKERGKVYDLCKICTKKFDKVHKTFMNTLLEKHPKINIYTFKLPKPVLNIGVECKNGKCKK